jgi:hypothetical protein
MTKKVVGICAFFVRRFNKMIAALTGRDAAVASILTLLIEVNFMFDRRASLPVWMAA